MLHLTVVVTEAWASSLPCFACCPNSDAAVQIGDRWSKSTNPERQPTSPAHVASVTGVAALMSGGIGEPVAIFEAEYKA